MHRLVIVSAALFTVGMLAITATAQAQQATPATRTSQGADPSVPLGVETAVSLASCPAGSSPAVSPGPPAAVNVAVQSSSTGVAVKLAGDWLSTGSTTFTVKCSATVTKKSTVTVAATPPEDAATGMGADIGGLFDQFSGDYNATLTSVPDKGLYSWDSTNPATGAIADKITPKANCTPVVRPDGSSPAIETFALFQVTSPDHKYDCVSFASSSRPRRSVDPPFAPGGAAFVQLAGDAVTWASPATTDAPATLTVAQLNAIYTCIDTNWQQVGGKNAPIQPFLPEAGSGTTAFFLAAIGVTAPGPCVNDENNTLQDGDGANSAMDTPQAIFPYSIGQYIAQRYHSATCLNSSCTRNSKGIICVPSGTQNLFGCDTHGTMLLKQIDGVAPTTGTGSKTVINANFPGTFTRPLFEVVPYDSNTADHIPGPESGAPGGLDLEKIFGASGWACTSTVAKADIKNYGFVLLGPACGATN